MSKNKPAATVETKPAAVAEPAKTVEPKVEFITSTHLAEKLGTKGTILRRWLRTLPAYQDSGYTRYKWDPADPKDAQFLKDAEASFKKHQTADSEKKEKRLEEARAKAEEKKTKAAEAGNTEKPAKKKKEKPVEPEPEESEDDEDFEDDEEGEEVE